MRRRDQPAPHRRVAQGALALVLLSTWLWVEQADACLCIETEEERPPDPMVVGTVLYVDVADGSWSIFVWPEARWGVGECGKVVEVRSAVGSCAVALPEVGDRWLVSGTKVEATGTFVGGTCQKAGLLDRPHVRDWLRDLDLPADEICEAAGVEEMARVASEVAAPFREGRACEEKAEFLVGRAWQSFQWSTAWESSPTVRYTPVGDSSDAWRTLPAESIVEVEVSIFAEGARPCWTRACLEQPADSREIACTLLRPGWHSTSCGILRQTVGDVVDAGGHRRALVLTLEQVARGPLFGGVGYPTESLRPERCP